MSVGAARALVHGLALAALLFGRPAAAQTLDLDTVLAPVVALEARIPEDARSADTLGTVRGGTGIVIDGTGLVVTVGYLILDASTVEVLPEGLGGPRVAGQVIAWDHATGLGLVRAPALAGTRPMPLGESGRIGADDAVIAVSWTRAEGLLPALVVDRREYAGYWEYLLEDALYVSPIHPAFPGAALVGLDGRLLGIGAFAHVDEGEEQDIAGTVYIPVDTLKSVLAELLLDGRSGHRRPWIGLYCEEVDGTLRVMRVPDDGPAARVGIRPGDGVVEVDGRPVASLAALYRALWSAIGPGETVSLTLERDGAPYTARVEAIDRHELLPAGFAAR